MNEIRRRTQLLFVLSLGERVVFWLIAGAERWEILVICAASVELCPDGI